MIDYETIAKQASQWSEDGTLTSHSRNLAGHLADLARLLADRRYGCPTEHLAAETMYRCLCRKTGFKERSSHWQNA